MYCYHCGYKIDEHKVEKKSSSFAHVEEIKDDTTVQYICPRCGHLIHEGFSLEDSKSLSRASHAEIQRAGNQFAVGMSCNSLGIIALIISVIFFLLSRKPGQGFKLIVNCAEFYVFVIIGVLAIALLTFGLISTFRGLSKKKYYNNLLNDIKNKTFVQ